MEKAKGEHLRRMKHSFLFRFNTFLLPRTTFESIWFGNRAIITKFLILNLESFESVEHYSLPGLNLVLSQYRQSKDPYLQPVVLCAAILLYILQNILQISGLRTIPPDPALPEIPGFIVY